MGEKIRCREACSAGQGGEQLQEGGRVGDGDGCVGRGWAQRLTRETQRVGGRRWILILMERRGGLTDEQAANRESRKCNA